MKKGIDVSKWQGKIDWEKVKKAGVEFAMIRAGYGRHARYKDEYFERNYLGAKAAGIYVGAYHYSYANTVDKAKQEAELFLSWLKGKQFDYPVCLDLEDPSLKKLGRKSLTAIADCFLSHVESRGYYVCLYSNKDWLKNYLDSGYLLKKYDLWLALWPSSGRPDTDRSNECGIWQYTDKGRVTGIQGNVDLNVSYKDYPSIITTLGLNGYTKKATNTVEAPSEKQPKPDIPKGKVRIKPEAKSYDGTKLASYVYNRDYDIIQVKGDRVVVGIGDQVTAAIHAADVIVKESKPAESNSEQTTSYTVKSGDTLWEIANKYLGAGVRYKEIIKENNLKSEIIYPGQKLKIPN